MITISRKALQCALAGLALAGISVDAQATDITLINKSSKAVHPYVRSNCWDPTFANSKPNTWSYFGTVSAGTEFTWPEMDKTMKDRCRNPTISLGFTLEGERPPTGSGIKARTTKMDMDGSVPAYTITIGDIPVVVSVTPNDDDHSEEGQGRPAITTVALASAPTPPPGLQVVCMQNADSLDMSTTCPVIEYHGYTTWVYSFIDNRISFALVTYDSKNNVVQNVTKDGARYVYQITSDPTSKSLTIWGQSNNKVTVPWSYITPN